MWQVIPLQALSWLVHAHHLSVVKPKGMKHDKQRSAHCIEHCQYTHCRRIYHVTLTAITEHWHKALPRGKHQLFCCACVQGAGSPGGNEQYGHGDMGKLPLPRLHNELGAAYASCRHLSLLGRGHG